MTNTADARLIRDHVVSEFTPEHTPAWYMTDAALGDWPRVEAWHRRSHMDGRHYSWLEALRAVAQNPPAFDAVWDQIAAEAAALP